MPLWLLKVWAWLSKVGAWLKRNWQWILLPIGVLIVLSRLFKRPPKVVSPELLGAAETQREARAEADEKVAKAAQERDARVAEIHAEHAANIEKLTSEQKQKAEELKEDPEALNSFLLDVGKDMRGD